ncbi:hypothetical protein EU538_11620 [Candidatus Thorarchaeota archaeon]|nr:MAG: hypothetical protein EU538_11620 [Candidatus Thorarchaeota archaeon]
MSAREELKTWSWIPKYWIGAYSILITGFLVASFVLSGLSFNTAYTLAVILLVAPLTYRKLVGGGCSLRFRVCALMKGVFAGSIMMILTFLADAVLFSSIPIITDALVISFSANLYPVWLFAGLIGGFAARIIEVRAMA